MKLSQSFFACPDLNNMSFEPILSIQIRALQREKTIERETKLSEKLHDTLNNIRLSVLDTAATTNARECIYEFSEHRDPIYNNILPEIITGVRKMFPDCHVRTVEYNGKNYIDVDPRPNKAFSIVIDWS
jgi:hypothetical protein